jgi:hypothetical protein
VRTTRQKLGISLIIAAVAVPLAVVSVAFACGRLTTLAVNPKQAKRGATISAFGRNYNVAPTSSPVTLRWNSRHGRELWTGRPAPNGNIDATFKVPDVRAGEYIVMATQTTANGAPAAGTPGRAAITIGKSTRSSSRAASTWTPIGTGGSGGGSGPHVSGPTGLLAALASAGLLSAGLILLRRPRRDRSDPTPTA